jgi:hypothetical protein
MASRDHSNKTSSSIKYGESLDHLRENLFLQKDDVRVKFFIYRILFPFYEQKLSLLTSLLDNIQFIFSPASRYHKQPLSKRIYSKNLNPFLVSPVLH